MRRGLVVVGVLLLTSGCGYRFGGQATAGITRVAVPVFDNLTLRRRLELTLTEVLQQEVRRRFDVALTHPTAADAVFRGRILSVREQVLVEGADDEVVESSVQIRAEVELWDRRGGTERLLAARRQKGNGTRVVWLKDGGILDGVAELREEAEGLVVVWSDVARPRLVLEGQDVERIVAIGPPLVERAEWVPARGESLEGATHEALQDLAERMAFLLERWE